MKETEEKQFKQAQKSKKPNLGFYLIILIAITIISSCLAMYAWARYTTLDSGTATAQVAKWYFNLKTGNTTIDGNTRTLLSLTRTDDRSYVTEGKLAPGTYGVLPIIVDTTGTETDLEYDVTITINNCPQNMVFTPQTPASTTQTVTGDGTAQSPRVRTIRIQKYIPYTTENANRQHDETITWDWPYVTTSGGGATVNDAIDTADSGKEVTVTITAVGTEVLKQPQVRLNEMTLKSNSFELNTDGTAQIEFENTVSVYSTETLTYTSNNTNVATVSNTGLITAQGVGTTTITIAGRDSTKTVTVNVTLPIGSTVNYTTSMNGVTLDNWKLFYNDTENNQVYLIYDDVIPNSVYRENNNGVSILKDKDNNTISLSFGGQYNVYAPNNRKQLITAMENTANWTSLTTGTMNLGTEKEKSVTGTFAMGSPTLDLWVKSWNEKYDDIYIKTTTNNMNDGLKGYYISKTNNPPNTNEYYISGLPTSDKLYFSRSNQYYWLASPSANASRHVMSVLYNGYVNHNSFNSTHFGFRPVVCLPSSVLE